MGGCGVIILKVVSSVYQVVAFFLMGMVVMVLTAKTDHYTVRRVDFEQWVDFAFFGLFLVMLCINLFLIWS